MTAPASRDELHQADAPGSFTRILVKVLAAEVVVLVLLALFQYRYNR